MSALKVHHPQMRKTRDLSALCGTRFQRALPRGMGRAVEIEPKRLSYDLKYINCKQCLVKLAKLDRLRSLIEKARGA